MDYDFKSIGKWVVWNSAYIIPQKWEEMFKYSESPNCCNSIHSEYSRSKEEIMGWACISRRKRKRYKRAKGLRI